MLDVCLPGTGGMLPLTDRWLTCCWAEYQGSALLIDCGEGTQIALKKCGCKLSRLNTLLFTHFHADHTAGLPGLLLSLGNSGKTSPLTIIGPKGLKAIVSALTIIAPVLPYPLHIVELNEEQAGEWEAEGMLLSYLPLKHSLPCFAYRITVKRKPVFNPQKAAALGIPKVFFKTLHAGQSVLLQSGRKIEPRMVLDGERHPISVCYCTDTLPMEEIADFARDSDLLISEGMYGDEAMCDKMLEKGHMLFSDSARIAGQAGAKLLWLTHYSPALVDPTQYLHAVRMIFPNTVAGYDGIRITLNGI